MLAMGVDDCFPAPGHVAPGAGNSGHVVIRQLIENVRNR